MHQHSRFARTRSQVEVLENRTLLSISMTSDGWVNISPSEDSRVIYVSSSSGDDHNDGTSIDSPLRTIKQAKRLMRDGKPDEMLLKRGDVFDESFGRWTLSGRSNDEPMLLGAYGEGDRPLLNTGTREGFATYGSSDPVNNIVIDGIHFEADGYDGTNGGFQTSGIHLLREGTGYLFQDLQISGYKDNVVLQGDGAGVSSVILRRSIITDAYNVGHVGNGHAQGLYASGTTQHLMIEQNVFDHNGWKEGVAVATGFNHNLYINTGATSVTVRNNIIARASLNGVLMRSGGTIVDNIFVRNPVAAAVDHTHSIITGNVVLEGTDLPTQTFGVGFNIGGVSSATVSNNLIAHDMGAGPFGLAGISINGDAYNTTVENNTVYDWRNNIVNLGADGIAVVNNILNAPDDRKPAIDHASTFSKYRHYYSGNIYSSKRGHPFKLNGANKTFKQWEKAIRETDGSWAAVNYSDPDRTVGTYNASLGADGSVASYLLAVREQSRMNWNPAYSSNAAIAYIRAGFDMETPVTTVKLKLSSKRAFLTTIEDGAATISTTTLAPKEGHQLIIPVSISEPAEAVEVDAPKSVVTIKDSPAVEEQKPRSPFSAQQSLIARLIGLA